MPDFFASLWEFIHNALVADPASVFQVLGVLVVSFAGGFASESNAITSVKDIFSSTAKVIFVAFMASIFVYSLDIDWMYRILTAGFIGLAGIPGVLWIAKTILSTITGTAKKLENLNLGKFTDKNE